MGSRNHELAPDEFYHVYNRGTDKRIIFVDGIDYQRFLDLLFLCNTTKSINVRDIRTTHKTVYDFDRGELLVSIGAFCLMPNHFHLLLTSSVEGGVTKFMGKLATSYSMYFNKRHERSGRLFQNRFSSQHASSDEYLRYLYAYIHLNPQKLQAADATTSTLDFVSQYPYSSLALYLKNPVQNNILSPDQFPKYFLHPRDHLDELSDWLSLGAA